MTDLGLKELSGSPLSPQSFDKLLRNPVYGGWIKSEKWGIEVRGLFDPIVGEALLKRVQTMLAGKTGTRKTRVRENPAFPLTVFVRCEVCGKGLAGGFSTSRNGKRHPYYACRVKGCRAVSVRRDKLHHQFLQMLYSLFPEEGFMRLFNEVVKDVWRQKHADSEQRREQARKAGDLWQARLERLNDLMLDAKVDEQTYQEQRERIGTALQQAHNQEAEALISADEVECLLEFAEWLLGRFAGIWNSASPENKRRLQQAVFPQGLTVSGEGFGTASSQLFFRQFQPIPVENLSLASPGGFEPPLPP